MTNYLCPRVRLAVATLAVVVCFVPVVSHGSTTIVPRAPGWGDLSYLPPSPGTYALPTIKAATDGDVITSDKSRSTLFELMSGRYTLLSFVFSRCTDVNGCSLANAVLHKVQARLNRRRDLVGQVTLLSMSFDYQYDTAEVLSGLEEFYSDGGSVRWEFLTAENPSQLQSILDGYGQYPVRHEHSDAHGHQVVDYAHLLRVYLIDQKKNIRNIYSVSFLHPDILLNDIDTLVLESGDK